ncbi:hypothetical protein SMACR_07689 [Sordaria macrospora]|uniref:WGS project CABT00000000 data, contig 2.27 n=2 Tax=Sordaria macrospora TaxID=5147 RepID=F7W4G1_SORMK|nr:uncharacterized protein SMAC_07689 [Sordaria macrospora k-hell]KAA8634876.1 hypothetical protein SMACR_07689 [Sordaria macrospora]WPJ67413.1 hypothetical protein SMAC4_07689 [Sordaria macrospora]CCC14914.1 unnamed protein product [Sordaria macrospora k-hell]
MCHRIIRTICPSCLRPAAYPQRHRLDQCFPPKIYTGWAPATAMYEKHRAEEETIPEVCHRCRYARGWWTWLDGGKGEGEEDESVGREQGNKRVEDLEAKAENVEWSMEMPLEVEESVGQKKGIVKEVPLEVEVEEKKVPLSKKGKRKAGEDLDVELLVGVETKRRRFP